MNRHSHTHSHTRTHAVTEQLFYIFIIRIDKWASTVATAACACFRVPRSLFPVPELICGRLCVFVMLRPERELNLNWLRMPAAQSQQQTKEAAPAQQGGRRSGKDKGKKPRLTFFLRSLHLIFFPRALLTFALAFLISLRRTQPNTYAQSTPPPSPSFSTPYSNCCHLVGCVICDSS